ncbi:molecular chaperone DnaK [Clostridium polyendosporum]|uniref:Molecular chaperone DnaK n=1 Tax=Clostridium polyendosporum TaxID=69208 RepID=A0A919RWW9_9CLOT|nr:TraR/DksA C4-type zinc finger protein [Clostridium polyendosporum]GIM27972.1 molecular chaperone DnaK [Clostridium polyendosporum]
MEQKELNNYKEKLYKEKQRINDLIKQLQDSGEVNTTKLIDSELSFYDNHDGDLGAEIFIMERGRALKGNENYLLEKVEDALKSIDDGTYGVCKKCGREISKERLDFLPYAQNCIKCQNEISTIKTYNSEQRPIEEIVIGPPFGYGYNDYDVDQQVPFDAEDSYQSVERFNRLRNIVEYYDDDNMYVEDVEKISNQQYRNQLPD